jgi:formylglycine-generating enzyme required for sulfatase activity
MFLVVLHGADIALGESNHELQNENNATIEAEEGPAPGPASRVGRVDDDKIAKRRAEIAQTNRDLKIIQSAIVEDLVKKGVTPPEHMALIPAGLFMMGLDETDLSGLKPAHRVYLDAYWIDQFPVTNEVYRACVEAKSCRPPMNRPGGFLNRQEYHDNPEFANFPVNYVRHEHAVTYCQWTGKRLPTEAEWEKAARGDDGRLYSWGDEIPEGFLDTSPIQPVGSMPEGASPYGVMNMGGNMWEWVADSYSGDFYANSPVVNPTGPEARMTKVKRGGDRFILTPWAVIRSPEWTRDSNPNVGFRCAKDLTIP